MKTISNRKPAVKVEQIIITVTSEQLRWINKRCDQYRVTPAEVAKVALFGYLYQDDENWLAVIQQSGDEKRTGKHPGWESCKEYLKKLVA